MLFVLGIGLDKRRLVKKMVVKSCGHKVAAISRTIEPHFLSETKTIGPRTDN